MAAGEPVVSGKSECGRQITGFRLNFDPSLNLAPAKKNAGQKNEGAGAAESSV